MQGSSKQPELSLFLTATDSLQAYLEDAGKNQLRRFRKSSLLVPYFEKICSYS